MTVSQISPPRAGALDDLDDLGLLKEMQGLPRQSERRVAACDVLVSRYKKLVRSCVRRYMDSP
jgi:hypothetical protein